MPTLEPNALQMHIADGEGGELLRSHACREPHCLTATAECPHVGPMEMLGTSRKVTGKLKCNVFSQKNRPLRGALAGAGPPHPQALVMVGWGSGSLIIWQVPTLGAPPPPPRPLGSRGGSGASGSGGLLSRRIPPPCPTFALPLPPSARHGRALLTR